MAANVSRWLKYAQAKLNSAVSSGNDDLDRLEAEREAELADRPWLASDDPTPTLDEARARIEWEAANAGRHDDPPAPPPAPVEPAEDGTGADGNPVPPPPKPTMDAEVAKARFEMDQQEQASKERLAAIRAELGVDPPDEATPKP